MSMTKPEPILVLRDNLAKLNASDQAFARSLLSSRTLSAKQHFWIGKLAERATQPDAPAIPATIEGAAGIVALFDKAAARLKRPKMLFEAAGMTLRLSVAGPTSKAPGSLNVTSADGDFDGRTWFGRITRDGRFDANRREGPATATAVLAALQAFGADPAGQAAAYGHRTGNCCFCALPLSDPRSTAVGYGKICAGNFGLPWGADAARKAEGGAP
jgi:Family of unknown function (DUF6011)